MKRANPAASVLNSVDHDVKTSRNAAYNRSLVVFIRWITNVQCEMEIALGIPAVDFVDPFLAFSCRLLPASRAAASGPKRFDTSLSDCHPEMPTIAWLIFRRPCDQSWYRLARNPNCDAHIGKPRTHKSELGRRTLSCVSHGEVSTG